MCLCACVWKFGGISKRSVMHVFLYQERYGRATFRKGIYGYNRRKVRIVFSDRDKISFLLTSSPSRNGSYSAWIAVLRRLEEVETSIERGVATLLLNVRKYWRRFLCKKQFVSSHYFYCVNKSFVECMSCSFSCPCSVQHSVMQFQNITR